MSESTPTSELVIVIADPSRPAYERAAREVLDEPGWVVRMASSFDDDELASWAPEADVLITRRRKIPDAFLDRAKRLRAVQHIGGVPRPEVVAWARTHDVPVEVTPSVGNVAVAEQALALLLALTRRILDGHRLTVEGAYRTRGLEPSRTSEVDHAFQWMRMDDIRSLLGATVGIVGFGDIGRAFAERIRGFGTEINYHQRTRLDPDAERELGVAYRSFDDLLASSDVVTLHVPHTEQTERMIDAEALASMKPGALLINAARGGLVDEEALVEALRSGRLGGAGLDVFVDEPVPHDHPLLGLDNVVLSPHLGSAPARGLGEAMEMVKPKLARMGRRP